MPRTPIEPIRPFHLDFTPLRQRRRYLELRLVDLAAASGVHYTTIWRTERNKTTPQADQLVAIARALGQPLHTLFLVVDE